ncbi:hypothetical protein [Rhodococcus globerulus]|uniref:hypothetical protein n=1 Tax=Rhodococcus globerulus TaxID=33008 RepID=UPI001F33796E|nr:hypothetical protein [Rhodococcus globerulus]MCE4269237.1 hypothetical protein [Rhodococcus globerulus]
MTKNVYLQIRHRAENATMDEQPRRRSNNFLIDYPLKNVTVGRRFDGVPEGTGRWQRIPHLGVLWTDDKEASQLGWLDGADQDAADALARRMVRMAIDGMTATVAFDLAARENPRDPIVHGDLPDRGSESPSVCGDPGSTILLLLRCRFRRRSR